MNKLNLIKIGEFYYDIKVCDVYDKNGKLMFTKLENEPMKRVVDLDNAKISTEYDDRGNLIYRKSDYIEEWFEYDDKGNMIHREDSYGCKEWRKYDERGNMVHCKYGDIEIWREYDKNNNVTHYKDSNGYEESYEYQDDGTLYHYENSKGDDEYYFIQKEEK